MKFISYLKVEIVFFELLFLCEMLLKRLGKIGIEFNGERIFFGSIRYLGGSFCNFDIFINNLNVNFGVLLMFISFGRAFFWR